MSNPREITHFYMKGHENKKKIQLEKNAWVVERFEPPTASGHFKFSVKYFTAYSTNAFMVGVCDPSHQLEEKSSPVYFGHEGIGWGWQGNYRSVYYGLKKQTKNFLAEAFEYGDTLTFEINKHLNKLILSKNGRLMGELDDQEFPKFLHIAISFYTRATFELTDFEDFEFDDPDEEERVEYLRDNYCDKIDVKVGFKNFGFNKIFLSL